MQANKGFTLIELMVAVAIAAIITAMAVPASKRMQADSRMASVANDLATALKESRSEAVLKRRNVNFNPNTGSWNNGWTAIPQGQTASIASKVDMPAGVVISTTYSGFIFNGISGQVLQTDNTPLDMTFKICNNSLSGERGYDISLNRFGRVVVMRHANSSLCGV